MERIRELTQLVTLVMRTVGGSFKCSGKGCERSGVYDKERNRVGELERLSCQSAYTEKRASERCHRLPEVCQEMTLWVTE